MTVHTVRTLAEELEIKPGSLQKSIRRWKGNPNKHHIFSRAGVRHTEAPTGLDDQLTSHLSESIKKEYAPGPTAKQPSPPVKEQPKPKPKAQPKAKKQQQALRIHLASAIFAGVIIAADATSCGWIAHNSYKGNFQALAAFIFAGVGLAIGFAAFRNIATYRGYNGDSYAWGFGIFQALIHLCAMQSFDYFGAGLSFEIGKIVISIALPIATAGLAVTFKPQAA